MSQLLQAYLPLTIFVGLAFVICAALLIAPFLIAPQPSRPREGLGL